MASIAEMASLAESKKNKPSTKKNKPFTKKLSTKKVKTVLNKLSVLQQLKARSEMKQYWQVKLAETKKMENRRQKIAEKWNAPDGGKEEAQKMKYYEEVMNYFRSDDLFVEGEQKKRDYKQLQNEIIQAQQLANYIIENATRQKGLFSKVKTILNGNKSRVALDNLYKELKKTRVVFTAPGNVIDIVKDMLRMVEEVAKVSEGLLLSKGSFQPFDEELSVELKF